MAAQSAIYSPLAVVINDCHFRILDAWTLTMTLTTQVNPVTLTTLTTPKILTTLTTPTFIFVFAFVMVLVSVNVRPHQLVANLTYAWFNYLLPISLSPPSRLQADQLLSNESL